VQRRPRQAEVPIDMDELESQVSLGEAEDVIVAFNQPRKGQATVCYRLATTGRECVGRIHQTNDIVRRLTVIGMTGLFSATTSDNVH
jgi:hypothetical protein